MADGLSLESKRRYKILNMVEGPSKKMTTPIPEDGDVFDYKFVREGSGIWVKWAEELKDFPPIPSDADFNQIIVPTMNTVRYTAIMAMLIHHSKPSLLVGPTGTGKSVYINVSLLIAFFLMIFNFHDCSLYIL